MGHVVIVPCIEDDRTLADWLGEQHRRGARRFELMRRDAHDPPSSAYEIIELSPEPLPSLADVMLRVMSGDRTDLVLAYAVQASPIECARYPDAIAFLVRDPSAERLRSRLDQTRLWRNVAISWLMPMSMKRDVDKTLNTITDAEADHDVARIQALRHKWQREWVLR